MATKYVVPAGTNAIRYHAGLTGFVDFTTTKRNVFSREELIVRPEDAGAWPNKCYGRELAERGFWVFKRRIFNRVWLLAVLPRDIIQEQ